jgi:hypothetical protein
MSSGSPPSQSIRPVGHPFAGAKQNQPTLGNSKAFNDTMLQAHASLPLPASNWPQSMDTSPAAGHVNSGLASASLTNQLLAATQRAWGGPGGQSE